MFEDHVVIHPNRENQDEKELIEIFRKSLIKFYRKDLGQYFNKKIDKQLPFMMSIEYGDLYPIEKHTHLHLLLQSDNEERLLKYHDVMETILKESYPSLIYFVKRIDTPEYRFYVYNYILKENIISIGKSDLCYKADKKINCIECFTYPNPIELIKKLAHCEKAVSEPSDGYACNA